MYFKALFIFCLSVSVSVSVSAPVSVPTCSYLGIYNSTSKKCVCETGWQNVDNDCVIKFKPKNLSDPNVYHQGLYDPEFPTWGGSVIEINSTYSIAFASTFSNRAGLCCWPYTSFIGAWESISPMGPWRFRSMIGKKWGHNVRFIIEQRLDGTYAAVIYLIMDHDSEGNYYQVYFGPINSKMCKNYAAPFPADRNQYMHVGYKILTAKTYQDALKEVAVIVTTDTLNGTMRINDQFTWFNLKPKMPISTMNLLNPQPLRSINGYISPFVTLNGKRYRILANRASMPYSREFIQIWKIDATHFIWEDESVVEPLTAIHVTENIEDPDFFESKYGYHLIVHDSGIYGTANRLKGSSILHSPDLFYWSNPAKFANGDIAGLQTAYSIQRRNLYFNNVGVPEILFGATVFDLGRIVCKNSNCRFVAAQGASRLYPIEIQYDH
jgi:hypothetical protein